MRARLVEELGKRGIVEHLMRHERSDPNQAAISTRTDRCRHPPHGRSRQRASFVILIRSIPLTRPRRAMKIGANEIKPGVVLELGRQAVRRAEARDRAARQGRRLRPGRNEGSSAPAPRRSSGSARQETVERAHLDEQEMQFLFMEGDLATFMDQETFEQINIDRELIGDPADFLARRHGRHGDAA
jgi:hypothetical protein